MLRNARVRRVWRLRVYFARSITSRRNYRLLVVCYLSVKGVIYLLIPVCRHCHELRFRKTKFLFHVKVKVAAVSTLNQMNARNIAPHSVQQQHLKIMKQKNCMINGRAPKWQENRPCAPGLSNKSQIVMIIIVCRRAAHYVTSCTNCLRFSLV